MTVTVWNIVLLVKPLDHQPITFLPLWNIVLLVKPLDHQPITFLPLWNIVLLVKPLDHQPITFLPLWNIVLLVKPLDHQPITFLPLWNIVLLVKPLDHQPITFLPLWNIVLLMKPLDHQPITFLPFYVIWRFITLPTKAHHLFLSWARLSRSTPSHPSQYLVPSAPQSVYSCPELQMTVCCLHFGAALNYRNLRLLFLKNCKVNMDEYLWKL